MAHEADEEGILLDPHDRNESLAQHIAHGEKLGLDEARHILKELDRHFGKDQGTRKFLYQLFPNGYGQQACKIAGMRKPRKLMLDV